MRTVMLCVALACVGCAGGDAAKPTEKGAEPGKNGDPVTSRPKVDPAELVMCFPPDTNGYTFGCQITGKGKADAPDRFSRPAIEFVENQGNDPTRTFKGRRWHSPVVIDSAPPGAKVEAGKTYAMHGTVVRIEGKMVAFTDCVFVAPK